MTVHIPHTNSTGRKVKVIPGWDYETDCAREESLLSRRMCSLAVSTQDSPAVEPRSNPGSGKILMSENLRLYTTSPVVMC